MHRSHTSLVAHAFMEAGLYIGSDLIGASPSNPYGHFESETVVDFHESIIRINNLKSWWSKVHFEKISALTQSEEFATSLSEVWTPSSSHIQSGWKDPRAALFLESWSRAYPQAKFVITVRHPIDVVRSLNKRVLQSAMMKLKPLLTRRHFNHWLVTNKIILDWVSRNQEIVYLLSTPDDLLNKESSLHLNQRLKDWGFDLDLNFEKVMDSSLIGKSTKEDKVSKSFARRKDVQTVFSQLKDIAAAQH